MAAFTGQRGGNQRAAPPGRFSAAARQAGVPVSALRRLARVGDTTPDAAEHCDLCRTTIPATHRHLLERTTHAITCACAACALLFERDGAGGGKYATVPTRVLALTGFRMTDTQWEDLLIPVDMAFIVRDSRAGRPVASYPGPAGVTESLLELDHWEALVEANPILSELANDVEALLINRVSGAQEYFLVPIDIGYELAGRIRTTWRGLSGGAEAWQAIGSYFADLRAKASQVGEDGSA